MKQLIVAAGIMMASIGVAQAQTPGRPASIGITGDTANVNTPVQGGVALIGGGGNVDGAFRWMINRSGGGDVVVLRATGPDDYHTYIGQLGKVHSVETLLIDSRELANNDTVAYIIRQAEMLFISGGDQSNYMRYWRGTKTMDAINYLLNVKKVPVGGTSAGCAVLSGFYYSGEKGSAVSATALANPDDSLVTVYNNDFLQPPFLQQVITDQHYLKRKREGRHITFMSRIIRDWHIFPKGIAPDERTAVCIDEKGMATVIGESKACFIVTSPDKAPEQVIAGKPLVWNHQRQALQVYEIPGTPEGNGHFNVKDFTPSDASGGQWYWWWVDKGIKKQKQ
ncbi:cyanophycinase [Chitinophaga nivalis]|uniref:Cyanophycinase n=1 Tax=Chitinophaga nivalis TaxID=2991709 RepID=A0ABT3IGY9_9BACT|nr:cyanophycinase [Chitinophaga nivalis]MCW3467098.1 cyanophycinase [Chitinophaga nivalis]MCW3483211.1 cyanophycinase [Chitinophaga nivalis]